MLYIDIDIDNFHVIYSYSSIVIFGQILDKYQGRRNLGKGGLFHLICAFDTSEGTKWRY